MSASSREIPFFNYPALFDRDRAALSELMIEVCSRGAYIMQEDLFKFEVDLATYLGVKHAIGVADGTIALVGALWASGIQKGDEVVVPSHTFVASAAAIHHVGAIPVLVEAGRDHLMDPESARAAVGPKTRGLMPVQLNGRTATMGPLLDIVKENDLILVEDSCQALGSKYKGRFAGTFGSAGVCSFYPSKTLGAFGDGGAIFTNDDQVAENVRMWRDHGRGQDGLVKMWGFNSRLDNLQAAVLRFRLQHYNEAIATRRQLASVYQQRLAHLSELLLPPGPDNDPDHFDIYQNYEIEADNRDELRMWLSERGVKTILQWGGYMIHQFKDLGFNMRLPRTERIATRFMLLPLHTALSEDDVHYICDQIELFYQSNVRRDGASTVAATV